MDNVNILRLIPDVIRPSQEKGKALVANLRLMSDEAFSCTEMVFSYSNYAILVSSNVEVLPSELASVLDHENLGSPDYGAFLSVVISLSLNEFVEDGQFSSRFGSCTLEKMPGVETVGAFQPLATIVQADYAVDEKSYHPSFEIEIPTAPKRVRVSLQGHGIFHVKL